MWKQNLRAISAILIIWLLAVPALAAPLEFNMPKGVTEISRDVYDLHMLTFWICTVIGAVVFLVMMYSMIRFRKSAGAVPAQFHHNTAVEVVWTVIPFIILVVMAAPSGKVLIQMYDTSDAELTVKVTGYQWKWGYEYLDKGVSFFSTLDSASNQARQLDSGIDPATVDHYLLNVDKPLVLPVGVKVRFLFTASDVIHAWWVPAFAIKKDAIPGTFTEAWAKIDEPGTYRGQCAELCGRDHGFMPIVVIAKPKEEFEVWLAEQKTKQAASLPAQGILAVH
jgi:cytochrome c oxidase subunit 2